LQGLSRDRCGSLLCSLTQADDIQHAVCWHWLAFGTDSGNTLAWEEARESEIPPVRMCGLASSSHLLLVEYFCCSAYDGIIGLRPEEARYIRSETRNVQ